MSMTRAELINLARFQLSHHQDYKLLLHDYYENVVDDIDFQDFLIALWEVSL